MTPNWQEKWWWLPLVASQPQKIVIIQMHWRLLLWSAGRTQFSLHPQYYYIPLHQRNAERVNLIFLNYRNKIIGPSLLLFINVHLIKDRQLILLLSILSLNCHCGNPKYLLCIEPHQALSKRDNASIGYYRLSKSLNSHIVLLIKVYNKRINHISK